jgi:hypothetical protein
LREAAIGRACGAKQCERAVTDHLGRATFELLGGIDERGQIVGFLRSALETILLTSLARRIEIGS